MPPLNTRQSLRSSPVSMHIVVSIAENRSELADPDSKEDSFSLIESCFNFSLYIYI